MLIPSSDETASSVEVQEIVTELSDETPSAIVMLSWMRKATGVGSE
jgi:hypothetical protein